MSIIGVMMAEDRADAQISSHFGKAQWIMVADTEKSIIEFVKNEGLNGKSAVEVAIRQGCTDVILMDIGDGALGHLQAAQIRAWAVPEPVAGGEAIRMFREGQLQLVPLARAATRDGGGHGCCGVNRDGSEATACCRG